MNLIKVILIALSGIGVGFTTTEFLDTRTNDMPYHEEETDFGCHSPYYEDQFLDHFLEQFSEENQVVINEFIDSKLVELEITRDDLFDNHELRHDFMFELHEFIEEQGIEFEETNNNHHGHMGGS